MSDYCLTSNKQFVSCIMARTYEFHSVDDVCIVLDQHAKLYFLVLFCWNNCLGRHFAPLWQTILILKPTNSCSYFLMMHGGEAANTMLWSLVWPDQGSYTCVKKKKKKLMMTMRLNYTFLWNEIASW